MPLVLYSEDTQQRLSVGQVPLQFPPYTELFVLGQKTIARPGGCGETCLVSPSGDVGLKEEIQNHFGSDTRSTFDLIWAGCPCFCAEVSVF